MKVKQQHFLASKGITKTSTSNGLTLSNIGLGTYLGDATTEHDMGYIQAIQKSVELGCNLIDTAINYRGQRSELNVSKALQQILATTDITREDLVIATKGGFTPADWRSGRIGESARQDMHDFYRYSVAPILGKDASNNERINFIETDFIEWAFNQSLHNLSLKKIDIYYLHNPEMSLETLGAETFYKELAHTFRFLESQVAQGKLGMYGFATWSGFLADESEANYLDLERILGTARLVGGDSHSFKVIQLPFNQARTEASDELNQKGQSILDAAKDNGLTVFTNVSLNQGKDFYRFTPESMINFLIEDKRVDCALIGMKDPSKVERNLKHLR